MSDLNNLITFLIGFNFINQISSLSDYRPYYCNHTELKSLRNLEISHFFIHDINGSHLFITTNTRIIRFRPMIIGEKDGKKTAKVYQPFILERPGSSIPEKKIIGYTVIKFENSTTKKQYEIYQLRPTLIKKEELVIYNNTPKFVIRDIDPLNPDLYTHTKFKYDLQYNSSNYTFTYDYDRNLKMTFKFDNQTIETNLLKLDYDVKYAAFYLNDLNDTYGYLYELDENQTMHFKRLELGEIRNKSKWNIIEDSVSLTTLLSCHQPFSLPRQVKGIFFREAEEKFYIFIDRFYLKLDEDLIDKQFLIENSQYELAKDLKFKNETEKNIAVFDLLRKWFIQLSNQSLLLLNFPFELEFDDQDFLMDNLSIVELSDFDCDQTIQIESYFFCFNEYAYYQLDESPRKNLQIIKSIFDSMKDVVFDRDEIFELIFNYKDKIVFMTEKNLYIIDRNQLKAQDEKIVLIETDEPIIKKPNHLFEKFSAKPKPKKKTWILMTAFFLVGCLIGAFIVICLPAVKKYKFLSRKKNNSATFIKNLPISCQKKSFTSFRIILGKRIPSLDRNLNLKTKV